MLADMLAFLSVRPEHKAGVNEIGRHLAGLGYTPLNSQEVLERSRPRSMQLPMLHPKALSKLLKAAAEQGLVKSDRPIGEAKRKQKGLGVKNWISLTKKGTDYLFRHKVRSLYGYLGLEWADDLWKKGYEIQFLGYLTGIERQRNFLFAWHPKSKDIKILQFFSPREYKHGNLIGFHVTEDPMVPMGQRIEQKNPIEEFIVREAGEEFTEENIGRALKKFFDYPKQHNLFVGQLAPSETVHFGMPMLLNFELISLIGVGYHEVPLIDGLQHETVALELPISESIVGELHLKLDVGKVNRWIKRQVKDTSSGIEPDAINFIGPELVCRHNNGKNNKNGECRLGLSTKCEFARTKDGYVGPPCERVKGELDRLLSYWSVERDYNL